MTSISIDPTSLELPQSVLDRINFTPYEDIALAVTKKGLTPAGRDKPDIPVMSKIPFVLKANNQWEFAPPGDTDFILVRRAPSNGFWSNEGVRPWVDTGSISSWVFTKDPNGDEKGALLSEAIASVWQQAFLEHWRFPDIGSAIMHVRMLEEPARKVDFADSTGPVQYADLPTGWWRYETLFEVQVRKF